MKLYKIYDYVGAGFKPAPEINSRHDAELQSMPASFRWEVYVQVNEIVLLHLYPVV